MTESVPWLVAKKKFAEAEQVLQTMAIRNRVKLDRPLLHHDDEVAAKFIPMKNEPQRKTNNEEGVSLTLDQSEDFSKIDREHTKNRKSQVPLRDLFCDRKLRFHLLMCNIFWFANVLVYSGLILISPTFGPNRFLSYSLMGIVEFPAYAVCLFLLRRYGRKVPQMSMFFLTGAVMAIAAFVPKETASGTDMTPFILSLGLVGKFGITSSFAIMGLYARELFPTTLRSSSSAWSTVGATFGSVIAPLASYLARHLFWLPKVLFAIAAITAGFATLPLPETANKPLALTTADIHRLYYSGDPESEKNAKSQYISADDQ